MDPKIFSKSSAGRVRRVGTGEAAYWAFVPAPLPPGLGLSVGLFAALSEADRALGELAGLGRNLPNARLLARPFARREAVLSSRIEGTQTNMRELYEFELREATRNRVSAAEAGYADAREVFNYVSAMEHGIRRLDSLPMSLRLIRELHQTLLSGARGREMRPGEFRRTQNWIGPAGCTLNEARFVPPPPDDLMTALGELEKYLHAEDSLPPLVRLALIHYQFEAIHPFLDGNGRIGRLLIVLLLVHWGLLPAPLLYLSAWFERNRRQYYELLLAVSRHGAWEDWLLYFLQGVKEEAANARERAARLLQTQSDWRKLVSRSRGTARMLAVVDMLLEQPYLAGPIVQARLECTHQTAMATLRKLAALKIVKESGFPSTNHKMFVATDILRAVER